MRKFIDATIFISMHSADEKIRKMTRKCNYQSETCVTFVTFLKNIGARGSFDL